MATITEAELLAALNRINASLRAVSVTGRIMSGVFNSIVVPMRWVDISALRLVTSLGGLGRTLASTTWGTSLIRNVGHAFNQMQQVAISHIYPLGQAIGQILARHINTLASSGLGRFVARHGPTGAAIAGGIGSTGLAGLQTMATATIALTSGLVALGATITGLVTIAAAFVSVFDPSIVALFNLALKDVAATFGQILRPIIAAFIPLIQQFGGVIATMGPLLDQSVSAGIGLLQALSGLFPAMGKLYAPLIQISTIIVSVLTPVVQAAVWAIDKLASALGWLYTQIVYVLNGIVSIINKLPGSSLLGLKEFSTIKYSELSPQSSVGKAVRSTSRMSSEDYGKKIRESAYGASYGIEANTLAIKDLTKQLIKVENLLKVKDEGDKTKYGALEGVSEEIKRVVGMLRAGQV